MALTKAGRALLRQLELDKLFDPLIERDSTADLGNVPWDGQSPRDLTGASEGVSLGHEGASLMGTDAEIEEMCRRHSFGW